MLNQEIERARFFAELAEQEDYSGMFEKLLTNMHLFCYEFIEDGKTRLRFLRLKARNEFRILEKLVKLGHANVYRISKSLKDAGHYSTILRALRRMERKGLVHTVVGDQENRSQRTYQATLLGQVITVLAEKDWKHAAEKIAAQSSRFLDCQEIPQALDSKYHQKLTYHVIESLMYPTTFRDAERELEQADEAVAECNGNWLRKNIIPKLNDKRTRSDAIREIEQFAGIPWMRSIVVQSIEEYVSETKDWLRKIDEVRQKSASLT